MAMFIFKKDNVEIVLSELKPGQLKESFRDLRGIIDKVLGPMQCGTHQSQPIVVLKNDGQMATLAGYGACCRPFLEKVHDRLERTGIPTSNFVLSTRKFEYVHEA